MGSKKKAHVFPTIIFSFFSIASKFLKDDATQVGFLQGLLLFAVKGLLPMTMVELIWL
jgi:hypothetical protein